MGNRYRLTTQQLAQARLISALAPCDWRTAAKAIVHGPDAIGHIDVRERVQAAMAVVAPATPPAPEAPAETA